MANFLTDLRAKRDAGEITTSSSSVKIAGEGHFTVKITAAEWGKNRSGDAEQGKISFLVVGVRKDTDKSEIGSIFSEYVSMKNEEMAKKKYLQITDWLTNAGVKDEKMVDEDDETLEEAMHTLINAVAKYCTKREVTANCFRKASDKVDSQGRPYYNNYFDDPNAGEEEAEEPAEKPAEKQAPKAAPKAAEKSAKLGTSPYKKHAVEDDDED